MKTSNLFRLLAAAPLAAALYLTAPAAEAASGRISVKVGEQTRSAFVIERYRSKRKLRPTIIVLGDAARVSTASRRGLRFQNFVQRGGVLVYAEAAGGKWNVGASAAAPGEVAYLRALIAQLRRNSLSDPRRIYLVGVGSGGIVSLQAACADARLFAGVAAALSSLPKDQPARCQPSRPTAMMLIVGDADRRMPIRGGAADLNSFKGEVASAEETVQAFARAAACSGKVIRTDLPDRDRTDASRIVIERQGGCKASVRLVRIQGGGHFLPAQAIAGRGVRGQNRDITTTSLITSLFKI
ncbi:MAG: alpha/beta hydrolase family esterase [Beijerinckiaceae bacterium]